MDLERILLDNMNVDTHSLTTNCLQSTMDIIHKVGQSLENTCFVTCELLWTHLLNGLSNFDDQLLCGSCFYTVLKKVSHRKKFLDNVLETLASDNETMQDPFKISLMYGLFQSAFLINIYTEDIDMLKQILRQIFKNLVAMANVYSQYTFIVFKIIYSFKKVMGGPLESIIFNCDNEIILLNLVCYNWESPINGVRDLNREIFSLLLSILDVNIYNIVLRDLKKIPWNKAKYLMITEIIGYENGNVKLLFQKNYDWIENVVLSLHKPGIVSAGTDMYFSILKLLNNELEWNDLFGAHVLKIMTGASQKAIDNFTNYWCLATFKKFPSLFKSIFEQISISGDHLYGVLCLFKQSNRLGLLNKTSTTNSYYISNGLINCDANIRTLSFDIVCYSHFSAMPTKQECTVILTYLNDNVNSDCTVLRLNMLNNLKLFLSRLHLAFINSLKLSNMSNHEYLYSFCIDLQQFVIVNLNISGNYQRVITTIKICEIILLTLREIPRRKRETRGTIDQSLKIALENNSNWFLSNEEFISNLLELLNDPAEDVRKTAVNIILNNYLDDLIELNLLEKIINVAMNCIRSKFFHEITCAQSMFMLLTNILITKKPSGIAFETVKDLFYFAYNELIIEYEQGNDVLHSIENGKQLHAFISTMYTIIDVSIQNSFDINNIISDDLLTKIIKILKQLSNQFAFDNENGISSDFAKINDMVQKVIDDSNISCENNEAKISDLHQIVLNCMWLNVKASCELCYILIKAYSEEKFANVNNECLGIIIQVLETSRHKGAIEAAGVALGNSIQHLTRLPSNSKLSILPKQLLICKINDLIEAHRMASVTRRGAGLSIMVHRIVSNDMNKGKPLFHHFMKTILNHFNKLENDLHDDHNEKDLPKALYIHFLTKIVTDSSLASDIMYYSSSLAELAFNNLRSEQWQIRNAALQLYGALVPKLIGQKKCSGTNEETIATVACDEFRVHSPNLWAYIIEQLSERTNTIETHSYLVPILNILANCAKRYHFSLVTLNNNAKILDDLIWLLHSPLFVVRTLTAKCIYLMYPFEHLTNKIVQCEINSENFLHGLLKLTESCFANYNSNSFYQAEFHILHNYFKNIMLFGNHSYLCKSLYDSMFLDIQDTLHISKVFEEIRNNNAIGASIWARTVFSQYIYHCAPEVLPEIFNMSLTQEEPEMYCKIVFNKIQLENNIDNLVLSKIADNCIRHPAKFYCGYIWEMLYNLSNKIDLQENNEYASVYNYLNENNYVIPYKIRYILPFAVKILNKTDNRDVKRITEVIFSLSDASNIDVEMRYVAAVAITELAHFYKDMSDDVKILIIKSLIMLYQDEDEETRNKSADFCKTIFNTNFQPYICLQRILSKDFLDLHLSEHNKHKLCKELVEISSKYMKLIKYEYNPFASSTKNIYFESKVFDLLVKTLG